MTYMMRRGGTTARAAILTMSAFDRIGEPVLGKGPVVMIVGVIKLYSFKLSCKVRVMTQFEEGGEH